MTTICPTALYESHHILADVLITSTSKSQFTFEAPRKFDIEKHPERLCWMFIHFDSVQLAKFICKMDIDKDRGRISLSISDASWIEFEDTSDSAAAFTVDPLVRINIPCLDLARMVEPFNGLAIDALTEGFMKMLDDFGRVFILHPITHSCMLVDPPKFNESDTTFEPGCIIVAKSQIREMLKIAVKKLVLHES